jgi:hypothetical protein
LLIEKSFFCWFHVKITFTLFSTKKKESFLKSFFLSFSFRFSISLTHTNTHSHSLTILSWVSALHYITRWSEYIQKVFVHLHAKTKTKTLANNSNSTQSISLERLPSVENVQLLNSATLRINCLNMKTVSNNFNFYFVLL